MKKSMWVAGSISTSKSQTWITRSAFLRPSSVPATTTWEPDSVSARTETWLT